MAVAAALALTLFLFNALLMLYARSVIQHAADAGARAGARSGGDTAACEYRADRTIADLANLYASSTSVECKNEHLVTTVAEITARITRAEITAELEPVFSNFGPDWNFTIRASSATEPIS